MRRNFIALLLLMSSFSFAQQCDSLSFNVSYRDPSCQGNDGQILISAVSGTGPFTTTGTGSNFAPGTYFVSVTDACGNKRTKSVTLAPYAFHFTFTFHTSGCRQMTFNFDATTPATYSVDGVNYSPSPLVVTVTPGTLLTLYAKDSCGNVQQKTQFLNKEYFAYIDRLDYRLQCDKLDIYPSFYGFNSPLVCLYQYGTNQLIACKQAPAGNYNGGAPTNFFNVPYNSAYYVIVSDNCYRDSMYLPDMTSAGGSQLDPYDWDCDRFKLHVDGPPPPASFFAQNPTIYGHPDSVCLFRASDNSLVGCKPANDHLNWINPRTGTPWPSGAVWDNLPYGSYYAYIFDPCDDTTYRIDSTVYYKSNFRASLADNCQVNQTGLQVWFDPGAKRPFTTQIIYPDSTVAGTWVSNSAYQYIYYNTFPTAGTLTVIQMDACGYADTSYLQQSDIYPNPDIQVQAGCPGIYDAQGGGNIVFTGNNVYTRYGGASVQIVKANGRDTLITHSYNSGTVWHFNNLSPATYILQSRVGCMGFTVYDTVTVLPYQYPKQSVQIVGCSNGFVTMQASVSGGVGPYTFQLLQPVQMTLPGPLFMLGVDTITPVHLLALDRCGNTVASYLTLNPVTCRFLAVGTPAQTPRRVNNSVRIYPNPSQGVFFIEFSNRRPVDYEIEILDAAGRIVRRESLKGVTQKKHSVNLRSGLWFVRINGEAFKQVVL